MEVSGAGARPDVFLQQADTRRDTQQTERSERQQRPEPTQRAEAQQPPPPAVEPPDRPREVVNTQGQVTGTRVNTTA